MPLSVSALVAVCVRARVCVGVFECVSVQRARERGR